MADQGDGRESPATTIEPDAVRHMPTRDLIQILNHAPSRRWEQSVVERRASDELARRN